MKDEFHLSLTPDQVEALRRDYEAAGPEAIENNREAVLAALDSEQARVLKRIFKAVDRMVRRRR